MDACDTKFMLTYDTPHMNDSTIWRDVGFEGSIPACAQILEGTYSFPSSTDTHTKVLLSLIGTMTIRLRSKLVSNNISLDDFI